MKVTIVPIVIGTFRSITKRVLNGLEDLEVGGRVDRNARSKTDYSHQKQY